MKMNIAKKMATVLVLAAMLNATSAYATVTMTLNGNNYAEQLQGSVIVMAQNTTMRLLIVARTPSLQGKKYEASMARAEAVRSFFVKAGIDKNRIVIVGCLNSQPGIDATENCPVIYI